MSGIDGNLQVVNKRITAAALAASRRPDTIRLLAVSKNFSPAAILDAAEAGQHAFGENYVQEALDKIRAVREFIPDLLLEWHFIGPMQSNKTRAIAEHFDWVHSVDREKIAQRLSEQRPALLPPLNICLQVNISGEASKSGFAPDEVMRAAHAIAAMPNLRLRGLMTIPEPQQDIEKQRVPFRRLREMLETLKAQGLALDTLSMGMSADLEAAIMEGATIVRVGTAIFGNRNYEK